MWTHIIVGPRVIAALHLATKKQLFIRNGCILETREERQSLSQQAHRWSTVSAGSPEIQSVAGQVTVAFVISHGWVNQNCPPPRVSVWAVCLTEYASKEIERGGVQ